MPESGLAVKATERYALMLPQVVVAGMRDDWLAARRWCAALDEECSRLGETAMGMSGLMAPLLLKGHGVARHYRDASVRTYVDFDLLVPVEEFDEWAAVLWDLGYRGPRPELAATRRRLQHSIALARASSEGQLGCDVHTCLFVETRARRVGYSELTAGAEPSEFMGLCEPSLSAQLVILALHMVQHPPAHRRLIWLRDLIELATADSVTSARQMAEAHGVGWAVEAALAEVEDLLGAPVWNARDIGPGAWGLAQVHRLPRPGYLHHVALVREFGLGAGARYLVSRVDPRRFTTPDDRIDWRAAGAWAAAAAKRAARTPWVSAWRRPS